MLALRTFRRQERLHRRGMLLFEQFEPAGLFGSRPSVIGCAVRSRRKPLEPEEFFGFLG